MVIVVLDLLAQIDPILQELAAGIADCWDHRCQHFHADLLEVRTFSDDLATQFESHSLGEHEATKIRVSLYALHGLLEFSRKRLKTDESGDFFGCLVTLDEFTALCENDDKRMMEDYHTIRDMLWDEDLAEIGGNHDGKARQRDGLIGAMIIAAVAASALTLAALHCADEQWGASIWSCDAPHRGGKRCATFACLVALLVLVLSGLSRGVGHTDSNITMVVNSLEMSRSTAQLMLAEFNECPDGDERMAYRNCTQYKGSVNELVTFSAELQHQFRNGTFGRQQASAIRVETYALEGELRHAQAHLQTSSSPGGCPYLALEPGDCTRWDRDLQSDMEYIRAALRKYARLDEFSGKRVSAATAVRPRTEVPPGHAALMSLVIGSAAITVCSAAVRQWRARSHQKQVPQDDEYVAAPF